MAVKARSDAIHDYDPPPGDGREHPDDVRNAIDENRSTFWATESYAPGGGLGRKSGVGLYLDAGAPVAARRLELVSPLPGWDAEVLAAASVPAGIDGWTRVSLRTRVDETEGIDLATGGRPFRYYLVWVVKLPLGNRAAISELTLLR